MSTVALLCGRSEQETLEMEDWTLVVRALSLKSSRTAPDRHGFQTAGYAVRNPGHIATELQFGWRLKRQTTDCLQGV